LDDSSVSIGGFHASSDNVEHEVVVINTFGWCCWTWIVMVLGVCVGNLRALDFLRSPTLSRAFFLGCGSEKTLGVPVERITQNST
jgi:hypothetical protein